MDLVTVKTKQVYKIINSNGNEYFFHVGVEPTSLELYCWFHPNERNYNNFDGCLLNDPLAWSEWAQNTISQYKNGLLEGCLIYGIEGSISPHPPAQKNNDGRTTCWSCGSLTKRVQSIMSVYDICTGCGK